jgi:predicted Zn-dependent protease
LQLLGRYPEAIPFLERTRARAPENLELSFVLGQTYIQARQAGPARTALARTFGLPPESPAAHVVTAQVMMRLQMESMAEAELTAALASDAKTPHANYLLGQIALFRGSFDQAVQSSSRELALNPTDAMALAQMGDALTRQGKWSEAVTVLQRSMWLNPYYSAPYILLGRAYVSLDNRLPPRACSVAASTTIPTIAPRIICLARCCSSWDAGTRRRVNSPVPNNCSSRPDALSRHAAVFVSSRPLDVSRLSERSTSSN